MLWPRATFDGTIRGMKGDNLSGVERLRSRLYQPGAVAEPRRTPLALESDSVSTAWSPEPKTLMAKKKSSWLIWAFVGALLFFILAIGFAFFRLYSGGSFIEAQNVTVEVAGPTTLASGGELDLQVVVTNKNNVPLEGAQLVVEYPPGTRVITGERELLRETLKLESLKPRESVSQSVKARIFGEKDSTQDIKFTVEYRLPGSGAIFDRKQSYPVTINSSPLLLSFDLPESVISGQEIEFTVGLESAAIAPLHDLLLLMTYPPGFTFKRATPAPVSGETLWRLGDFAPGAKREIKIRGVVEGENEETRSFRALVGTEDPEEEGTIALNYGSLFALSTIEKPEIALEFSLDGNRGAEQVAASDQVVRADLTYFNNLPVEIRDATLEIKLSGRALKPTSVVASPGFYNSLTNSVLWTKIENRDLAVIPPGGTGRLSFSFAGTSLYGVDGQTINLVATFRARKTESGSGSATVQTVVSKKVKLSSVVQLSTKALHGSGPFEERGPIPPRVGRDTTYTVVWSVANTASDVDQAFVRATLPSYIKWAGVSAPAEEKITFNPNGGEVVWDLGLVKAGRGYSSPPRQVSFQVTLLPSLSQVGTAPNVVSAAKLTGTDIFTNARLESSRPALNTELRSEPDFELGDEKVNP